MENAKKIVKKYENMIKNAKNKEEIKEIVRIMYRNIELSDIDFNDLIYTDVYEKLRDDFKINLMDKDGCILYDDIIQENY